jgi:hypothetical protein
MKFKVTHKCPINGNREWDITNRLSEINNNGQYALNMCSNTLVHQCSNSGIIIQIPEV